MKTWTAALALMLPLSAFAGGLSTSECTIETHKNDRVAKGRDLVVEEDAVVEDVVVIDGDVTLRKGVRARTVMVLHGSITLEPGVNVSDGLIAVGGVLHVDKSAVVKGSRISIKNGVHVRGDEGEKLDLNISFNGKSLARELLKPMLEKFHDCQLVELEKA